MLLTEDKLVEWVESENGLVITRSKLNENEYDFSKIDAPRIACITGYNVIIQHFFNNVIQYFKKGVVLVIIESDVIPITQTQIEHINLLHCFTWNMPFHHSKISPLPIGLNYNRQLKAIEGWLDNNTFSDPKKILCMNCSLHTDPTRQTLLDYGKDNWNSFCEFLDFIPSKFTYMIPSFIEGQLQINVTNSQCYDQWKDFRFVLSPRGAGLDCHRTWEALAIGLIPIMLSSTLDDLFKDLPVVILRSWSEMNESFLQKTYEEIVAKKANNEYNMDQLHLNYWTSLIQTKLSIKRPKVHFITYGNENFEQSKKRILLEAENFKEFDTINGYGPSNIDQSQFSDEWKEVFLMNRGGGYWIWRPYIIQDTLDKIEENDFVIYLDAGCTLNTAGKKRFYEYLNSLNASNYGILSFQMSSHSENVWTTKEIFDYFHLEIGSNIGNSGQYVGGVLVMQKNKHLLDYMEKYKDVIYKQPYLCSDKYNSQQKYLRFNDNRHEQSVTSVLRKIMGSHVIVGDESWKPPFGTGESLQYPFWATRKRC